MTREIKFRAWDKENKKMYPSYPVPANVVSLNGAIECLQNRVELMQFTGLKDKNEEEIYEGDIVQMTNALNERMNFQVWWGTGYSTDVEYAGFRYGPSGMILNNDDTDILEIIGNIYENPDLLKA